MKSVSGTTTYFAPDESNNLIAENDAGVWVDYLWLNGRLIGRIHGGQVQDIHVDHLGRPEAMTDANQTVVWRAMNFPFSRSVATNNVVPLNIGFPGQYFDAELNLWNNGSRDYFYWVGRYLESDPIGLGGGINTYTYAGGNPLSHSDPLGMDEFGDMQGAFCPGGLCTLPQNMIQNSWGTPNMAPVYIMDSAALIMSGGAVLPEVGLGGFARTLLLANAVNGALDVPPAIIAGEMPTQEILAQELEYIVEEFESIPPPRILPVPTSVVASPLAVPAGDRNSCPR
ncbi:RHS repeat domain-containing protein [Dyella choica]|uniref:RHS protein conserved region domain-containing protein n=1 Tax=Dyella choica TaxID=1927959 RepID=A0A3S0R0X9_9GAMM|nr:RHS repeat-associated core domain-containing protein [Dyella choica]RUL70442.1 hypothetical protein EKH80_20470 [Dyella choica]